MFSESHARQRQLKRRRTWLHQNFSFKVASINPRKLWSESKHRPWICNCFDNWCRRSVSSKALPFSFASLRTCHETLNPFYKPKLGYLWGQPREGARRLCFHFSCFSLFEWAAFDLLRCWWGGNVYARYTRSCCYVADMLHWQCCDVPDTQRFLLSSCKCWNKSCFLNTQEMISVENNIMKPRISSKIHKTTCGCGVGCVGC